MPRDPAPTPIERPEKHEEGAKKTMDKITADDTSRTSKERRRFLAFFAASGLSSTLFPGVLWGMMQRRRGVTKEMVESAERVTGLQFSEEEREMMVAGVNDNLRNFRTLRRMDLPNQVPPALHFDPLPPGRQLPERTSRPLRPAPQTSLPRPADLEEVAFWPVTKLSRLLRERKITSVELTEMYLSRLKRCDTKLQCVVNLTEELALEQATRADREIRAGKIRGPLHGIPWGAKDLLATKGYPTTWGAAPFKDQVLEENATVVDLLEKAGAVLVAKLSLGALAWGDVWFGGTTRNPWNLEQGSSGSSAGPASATAAGLVGFSIGSETWGSIVSPSTRCGVTGLRPTFGLVSRAGAMALSWSMDKLGPMCRSVEDCALVLHAIAGAAPGDLDPSVRNVPFNWDGTRGDQVKNLRIGYVKSAFESTQGSPTWKKNDEGVLKTLRDLGCELRPIELPKFPVNSLSFILNAEAAAAFDELTRSDRDDELVRQVRNAWPNVFRQSRLIPAVEYIQANRARTQLLREMDDLMADLDVYVCPSFGADNLLLTNLTGHPSVCLPNGFSDSGDPTSITFMGKLFGDEELLRAAKAYQDQTDFHRRQPEFEGR